MGRTSRKRKLSEAILERTLVHLPEPPKKKRKLDNMETAQDHETTEDDGSQDYLTTPQPTPRCKNPAVNHAALGELLYHKSTRILEARLVASGIPDYANSIPKLFNYLFLSTPYPRYDSVCFRTAEPTVKDWRAHRSAYQTRSTIHLSIFTYILKRISCLPIIQAEGYLINHHYSIATDAAFIYFLHTLLRPYDSEHKPGRRWDRYGNDSPKRFLEYSSDSKESNEKGEKPSNSPACLVIEDERTHRAFEIFTQHPFRFLVQMKVGHNLLKEDVCVVWCPDVGQDGGWDVVWEYMTKALADVTCPKTNYEF